MSTDETKLRGNKPRLENEWKLGAIPESIIKKIGEELIYRIAIGQPDTGDDFGNIFAAAIEGRHRKSSSGIVDVVRGKNAWSVKTLHKDNPLTIKKVNLISGRNSPIFSHNISDPHHDVDVTGRAVLSIWNARFNEALHEYNDLRIVVILRNTMKGEFLIFEEKATEYAVDDYVWEKNVRGNLEGYEKSTGEHKFTWQPHGAQFTVIRRVPGSAITLHTKEPDPIEKEHVLRFIGYDDSWIHMRRSQPFRNSAFTQR
jgi:hypothetical protein